MTTINLKDFYYWYLTDELVEVPDEVAEELMASKRREAAHAERVRYNKAFYKPGSYSIRSSRRCGNVRKRSEGRSCGKRCLRAVGKLAAFPSGREYLFSIGGAAVFHISHSGK